MKKSLVSLFALQTRSRLCSKRNTRIVDPVPILNQNQFELANEICDLYECHLSEILFKMFPSGKRPKDTVPTELAEAISLPPLLPDQEVMVDQMKEVSVSPGSSSHLIEGITGSGKTRVYLEMVHFYLEKNLGILFLLPK